MKYKLIISNEQAKIISIALDFYSRTMGGQFEDIVNRFHWRNIKNNDERDRAFELFRDLKCMLTGLQSNQPNIGLGNISEKGRIAYDLHQVIRYQLANDNPNSDYRFLSVDFDPPHQESNEPLAQIEPINS